MADELDFIEEAFDAKAWVNAACAKHTESPGVKDEPLEKFLAELEMKLQLAAEEIEASLQDSSAQAMRRIPFAVQEIYRLQGDIQGMQDQVKALTQQIQRDAAEAADSVETIGELDRVKRNMESACSTLREATELSGLFIKVEDVFAAGDLPKVAEILSSMRRSLSLVGDVPEFRAGRDRLQALEDRLQAQVEGSLSDALSRNDEAVVNKLCGLLLAVDRYTTIEGLYCNSRLALVFSIWEELSSKSEPPAAWLPRFYTRLLSLLESEHHWAARVLPTQQPRLMASLVNAIFQRVGRSTRECLAGINSIATLASLQRDVVACARSVADLLKDSPAAARTALLSLVFEPLEAKVATYGDLEAQHLSAELAATIPPGGLIGADDAEGLVAQLSSCLNAAFTALSACVERCIAFTGGTELREAVKTVDSELSAYLVKLRAAVSGLHARHAALPSIAIDGTSSSVTGTALPPADNDAGDVSNILKLILVARELTHRLLRLEASLRTTIATLVPRLEFVVAASTAAAAAPAAHGATTSRSAAPRSATPSAAPSAGTVAAAGGSAAGPGAGLVAAAVAAAAAADAAALADPVALRLSDNVDKLQKLQKLLSSLQDTRYLVLPSSSGAADTFTRGVHTAVFDVLLLKVREQLRGCPELQEWKREASGGPSFSAYPMAYVQAIGEYLMALPGQLEVLMAEEEEEGDSGAVDSADVEELAAEWLDKVVSGAATAYLEHIYCIPELSTAGGQQLAADIEYFANVMSALHVVPPAALLTVQLFASTPADHFAEAARAATADGSADAGALRAVTQMRRLG